MGHSLYSHLHHPPPRPRIQRAFLVWYYANRHRFLLRPLFTRRNDRSLTWRFHGIQPAITGFLGRTELSIDVQICGDSWDLLLSLDAIPRKNAEGYVCDLCMSDHPQVFADRPALW